MMRRVSFVALYLVVCAGFGTVVLPDEMTAPPAPDGFVIQGDAEAGKDVFLKRCAVCHGENGDGSGRIRLDPPARDLRDRERMSRRTDWEIYVVIRDGGKVLGLSEKMLPWGNLVSEQELHDLTDFIRKLSEPGAEVASQKP